MVQSGIKSLASRTFEHLHTLDLNFHLNRNTGALNRSIDRGSRSLNFVLTAMAFNVLPTLAEIGLVCGVLGYTFGASYCSVAVATLAGYISFTVGITTWRTKFRKDMNKYENQASSIAFDSLLNYETVKVRMRGWMGGGSVRGLMRTCLMLNFVCLCALLFSSFLFSSFSTTRS